MKRHLAAVIVVEDSAPLRETLLRALAPQAPVVIGCESVAQFLAQLPSVRPDLVVTDVDLPDGDAFDVLKACWMLSPRPLIVALSGVASPDEAFRLAQLGVHRYVSKPLDLATLESAIADVLATPPDPLVSIRANVGHVPMRELEGSMRKVMLDEALARSAGNRRGAARLLSISRQHLQHLIRKVRGDTLTS